MKVQTLGCYQVTLEARPRLATDTDTYVVMSVYCSAHDNEGEHANRYHGNQRMRRGELYQRLKQDLSRLARRAYSQTPCELSFA